MKSRDSFSPLSFLHEIWFQGIKFTIHFIWKRGKRIKRNIFALKFIPERNFWYHEMQIVREGQMKTIRKGERDLTKFKISEFHVWKRIFPLQFNIFHSSHKTNWVSSKLTANIRHHSLSLPLTHTHTPLFCIPFSCICEKLFSLNHTKKSVL